MLNRAIVRIAEDKLRNLIADHGAAVVALPRRLSGVLGLRGSFLKLLMLEHRLSLTGRVTPLVKDRLPEILDGMETLIGPCHPGVVLQRDSFRAIVLREPQWQSGRLHKGVLLIKFTETFRFFFHQLDVPRLMRFFNVVLEPSWSGYCLPEILFWARYADPVIVQASEALDREFLAAIDTNLVPIEIGASDWVDHRVFRPIGIEKSFDVVYIANLTPIKRVNVYLRAISTIARQRPGFKAAIVLSSWGGNQTAFEQLIRFYAVERHLTVLMNQTQAQLNEILNRSRVSVLLSRKEGSNKTLFESLFADTPVILLRNNVGVNKHYINSFTGRLVDESELPATILAFVGEGVAGLAPRTWAMANISPERSTQKLRVKLAQVDPAGEVADAPLYVKINTPEATYMDPDVSGRMPNVSDVLECFLQDRTAVASEAETQLQLQRLFREVGAPE